MSCPWAGAGPVPVQGLQLPHFPPFSVPTAMQVSLCLVLALAVAPSLCRPPAALGDPQEPPPSLARRDWPQQLSQEQQHLLSQFLPHLLTGTASYGWLGSPGGHSPAPVGWEIPANPSNSQL